MNGGQFVEPDDRTDFEFGISIGIDFRIEQPVRFKMIRRYN